MPWIQTDPQPSVGLLYNGHGAYPVGGFFNLPNYSGSALPLSRRAAGMVLGGFMTGVKMGSTSIYGKVSPSAQIQGIPVSTSEEAPLAIFSL